MSDWRAEVRRCALPALVLVAAILAGLAVRGALRDDNTAEPEAKQAARAQARPRVKRAVMKSYVVEYGDTLGQIAERNETTVERLRVLNPGIEPTALRVGVRVRLPAPTR